MRRSIRVMAALVIATIATTSCDEAAPTSPSTDGAVAYELCRSTIEEFLPEGWSMLATIEGNSPFDIPVDEVIAGDAELLSDPDVIQCTVIPSETSVDSAGDERFVVVVKPPSGYVVGISRDLQGGVDE